MQVLILFLLFTICDRTSSVGVYIGENDRLQRDLHRGEFFFKIGDWFGDLKNEIQERLFGPTTTPIPNLPMEILNLDKFQLQRRLRDREWFLLNLTNLTFDPNHDWGFHVGNWYFIRKGCKDRFGFGTNFDDSDLQPSQTTTQSKDTTEVNIEETFEIANDFVTTEISSDISTSVQNEMPSVTTENTMQTYSSESSTLKTYESEEDDVTTKDFVQKGSVEVLMD